LPLGLPPKTTKKELVGWRGSGPLLLPLGGGRWIDDALNGF